MFDEKHENLRRISEFIEEASSQGTSVLIHSVRGQSRACCAVVGHLMFKYQWSLFKSLEFLNSRRPGAEIRASFFQQLETLEAVLNAYQRRSTSWSEVLQTNDPEKGLEEAIVRHTFMNSRQDGEKLFLEPGSAQVCSSPTGKNTMVKWADKKEEGKIAIVEIIGEALQDRKTQEKNRNRTSSLKGSRKMKGKELSPFQNSEEKTMKEKQKEPTKVKTPSPTKPKETEPFQRDKESSKCENPQFSSGKTRMEFESSRSTASSSLPEKRQKGKNFLF